MGRADHRLQVRGCPLARNKSLVGVPGKLLAGRQEMLVPGRPPSCSGNGGLMWHSLLSVQIPILEKVLRTIAVYLLILLIFRLVGKRSISSLNTIHLLAQHDGLRGHVPALQRGAERHHRQ